MRRPNPTRHLFALAGAILASAIAMPQSNAQNNVDDGVIILPPFPIADSVAAELQDTLTTNPSPISIHVTYSSSTPISPESLDDNDIWVTSRNGYNQTAEFRSFEELHPPIADPTPNGIIAPFPWFSVRATYTLRPETDQTWAAGEYAVLLQRDEVTKADGSAFPPQLLGFFTSADRQEPQDMLPFRVSLEAAGIETPSFPRPGVEQIVQWRINTQLAYGTLDGELISSGELQRDGNRFSADVVFRGVPDPDFDPTNPVGFLGQSFSYLIGELEDGDYSMELTSFGETIGQLEWTVGDVEPEPAFPVDVQIDVRENPVTILIFPPPPPSYVADVRLEFAEQGSVEILSWGEVVRDGQEFRAEVEAIVRPWPVDPLTGDVIPPPGVPPIFEHQYQLGSDIEPGQYRFRLTSRDRLLGAEPFTVTDDDPAPQGEVELDIVTDEDSALVRARVQLFERSWFLSDPGVVEPTASGGFVINATASRGLPNVDPNHNPSYPIPDLEPGVYHLLYQINGHPFANVTFEVTGDGGGGEEPPNVLGISPLENEDGTRAVEVTVILPGPNFAVLDRGHVRRDGNHFAVSIRVAPTPDGVPGDPFPGGGFRIFLDRHTYELGALEAGNYRFSVVHEGEPVASEGFEVEPEGDQTPPEVNLEVANIEEPKTEAHPFHISFNDRDGLDQASIADATVWVINERLDYRAEARQLSIAFTEDILGSGASARYEVGAPGDGWDVADRGRYEIHIKADKVRDRQGNAIARSLIGSFKVSIWPDPDPHHFPRSAEIEIAETADGHWNAGVSIELPEALAAPDDWIMEWGDVRHFGHVLVAKAHYRRIGERPIDNMPADGLLPEQGGQTQTLTHDYDLGALREGRYLFVFLSNLGHFGKQRFDVGDSEGGPERPEIEPFEAWQAAAFMPGDWAGLPMMVDPGANPDGDPWSNFEEYAFGFDPLRPDAISPPVACEIIAGEHGHHLAIRYHELLAAHDVEYRVLGSADLVSWEDITDQCEQAEREPRADGTVDVLACLRAPLDQTPFTHLRIMARPRGPE